MMNTLQKKKFFLHIKSIPQLWGKRNVTIFELTDNTLCVSHLIFTDESKEKRNFSIAGEKTSRAGSMLYRYNLTSVLILH